MRTPRVVDRRGSLCVLVLLANAAVGQNDEVPPPPQLAAPADRPAAAAARARAPDGARLAPLPEERDREPEEIIVLGGNEWRLPDLGSSWRAEREAEEARGRLQATLLPLYDPENPPIRSDLFFLNREAQRLGYIELFRVRFGRRSRD
ncbi:MAG TPA: hypothetical protein VJA26_14635 [Gammaproteobacteria bacterium]|nr:hypothetical protein [Gammaproteobacteria bacterium]